MFASYTARAGNTSPAGEGKCKLCQNISCWMKATSVNQSLHWNHIHQTNSPEPIDVCVVDCKISCSSLYLPQSDCSILEQEMPSSHINTASHATSMSIIIAHLAASSTLTYFDSAVSFTLKHSAVAHTFAYSYRELVQRMHHPHKSESFFFKYA